MREQILVAGKRLAIVIGGLLAGLLANAQSGELVGVKFEHNLYPIHQLIQQLQQSKSDTATLRLLVDCGQYYADQHVCCGRPIDSAGYFLNLAAKLGKEKGSKQLQGCMNILLAYTYCVVNNYKTPEKLYLPLITNFAHTGDEKNEMLAWQYFRKSFILSGDTSTAMLVTIYERLTSLSGKLNHNDDSSVYRRSLADLHLQQRKTALAETELLQLVARKNKLAPQNLMFTYDLLSGLFIKKGQMDKALEYALLTENMMQQTGDSSYALTFYSRLGKIYAVMGDYSASIEWNKKAFERAFTIKAFIYLYRMGNGIAAIMLKKGDPNGALLFIRQLEKRHSPTSLKDSLSFNKSLADCYLALKQYHLAEAHYLKMMQLLGSAGEITNGEKAVYAATIGLFYYKQGQYTQAKKYYLEELDYCNTEGIVDMMKDAHASLFRADSALGDYQSAIKHLEQNDILKDSIFSIARNKQLEELQIAYRTEQKEKDIKLLQEKENVQRIQLERSATTRNWIISGSVMLLVIASLLFRQSSLRKINNSVITQKNQLLQNLVTEKEWLLKEVHHRVKNNLHTVICLLESQAKYLENDALKAIENSQHRIYAMSLIHQKLYQTEDIRAIDMATYINEFIQYLDDSFGAPANVHIHAALEPIKLGITQAIPVGLIINEAVTNCFKYAFPAQRRGQIDIRLNMVNGKICLEIADNGIGFSTKGNTMQEETLGISLINGLARDIGGTINFNHNNGTLITIQFAPEALQLAQGEALTSLVLSNQEV